MFSNKIFCLTALRKYLQGVLPKHVAFIMDGNRRFAANRGLLKSEGHRYGFSKLTETITWCHDLGITEVSVYAFSIENFKRPESEVNFLMNLAAEKFQEFIDKNSTPLRYTPHSNCLAVFLLLPKILASSKFTCSLNQPLQSYVLQISKFNGFRATLNILLAYATRDELTHAAESIRLGVQEGVLLESDISPDVISRCCYLRASQPVDIIVRTSGEVRLSDFMVWQAVESSAVFYFFKTFWPTFTFWHLAAAILRFQFNRMVLRTVSVDVSTHFFSSDGRRILKVQAPPPCLAEPCRARFLVDLLFNASKWATAPDRKQ
ncbi:unnamed protein product [Schistocephalus solidus]|uniref:Alkyl transferase n=1 Tax=Schistocephalus solidus TaxID=70667 RepID=A0A183SMN5_SCHSO|nr:unnamed protein product [Schistocephalus solidus]